MGCLRERRKAEASAEKNFEKVEKVLDKSRTTW